MIRAENVTFDYESMDEEGNVESRKRAVNHVNLKYSPGSSSRYWAITVPVNPRLRSISMPC